MRFLSASLSLFALLAATSAVAEVCVVPNGADFASWCGTEAVTAVVIDTNEQGAVVVVTASGEAREGAAVGDIVDCDDGIGPCDQGLPAAVLVGTVGQLLVVEPLFDNEVGTMVAFDSAVEPILLDAAIDAAFLDDGAACIDRLFELSNTPRSTGDLGCRDPGPFGAFCGNIEGDIGVVALGVLLVLRRRRVVSRA